MTDYFFISSPLHFLIAANISIQSVRNESVLVIMARDGGIADRFRLAAEQHPDIFNRIIVLPIEANQGRRTRSPRFRAIKELFSVAGQARLFTGNDRRLDFQYAMHVATESGARPQGIYMDEGAVTYMGHKSMNRIAHRYIDPLFKRLFIGRWYQPAITTGASAWVDTLYAAFPEHVHPLLKKKPLVAIASEPFATPQFKALARDMLPDGEASAEALRGIKVVVTLPHEASYIHAPATYEAISGHLLAHFEPSQVAIKPHPRITDRDLLTRLFPGAILLEPTVGMEVLLALLDEDCLVAGDISSTLLTTKWLRPSLPVVALMVHAAPPELMTDLYTALEIPMVAPEALPEWLSVLRPVTKHR